MVEIDDLWVSLNKKQSLRYPYSPQRDTFPKAYDVYKRNIRRLLHSYVCLGKKLLNDTEDKETIDKEEVLRMLRVCGDGIKLEDLDFFSESLRATTTTTSTIILGGNNFSAESGLDWNQLLQVVFIHPLSPMKVAVYFADITSELVDVFAIGPCEKTELQEVAFEIMLFLWDVLPEITFSFQFRVQIPAVSFAEDKLFLAYILAVQLHQRSKYLCLDSNKLDVYKWKCVQGFQTTHDSWLGKLNLDSQYSFVVRKENNDDNGELRALGWALVDVPGDGNCGAFVFILGLENNNRHLYNPYHFDHEGQEFPERRDIDIGALKLEWQQQAIRMRQALRNESVRLLKKYKPGQEPPWWWICGPFTQQDRIDANDGFYMRGYSVRQYFPQKGMLPMRLMMVGAWAGFVFASLFRMRVVLIVRHVTDSGFSWGSYIFSSGDVTEPESHDGIKRLSDDEYRKEPTVEIFQTGGDGLPPHFQFLRRAICHEATNVPLEQSNETLLSILKHAQGVEKVKPPVSVDDHASKKQKEAGSVKSPRSVENVHDPEKPEKAKVSGRTRQLVDKAVADDADNMKLFSDESSDEQEHSDEEKNAPKVAFDKTKTSVEKVGDKTKHQAAKASTGQTVDKAVADDADKRNLFSDESSDEHVHSDDEKNVQKAAFDKTKTSVDNNDESGNKFSREEKRKQRDSSSKTKGSSEGVNDKARKKQKAGALDKTKRSAEKVDEKKRSTPDSILNVTYDVDNLQQRRIDDSEAKKSTIEATTDEVSSEKDSSEASDEDSDESSQDEAENKKKAARGKNLSKFTTNKRSRKELGDEEAQPRRSRRLGGLETEFSEEIFNQHYHARTLKHKSAARLKYDPVLGTFWVSQVQGLSYTPAQEVADVSKYDDILVNQARNNPGIWQGCSIGDPFDGDVPSHLSTSVRSPYRQHNNKLCLSLSLANALFYCNFHEEARILDTQARVFAKYTFETQLKELLDFVANLVPLIGRPTIYRQCRHQINKTKKRLKKARPITWDELFSEIVPHPTIVIPLLADGTHSHAFCIVDDLIFDSSFPYALKLQRESVDWIFNGTQVCIYQALRFNVKNSPKGIVLQGWYDRNVTLNWDGPSREAIKRVKSSWYLPHYVTKK